jgi:hypothetical protein
VDLGAQNIFQESLEAEGDFESALLAWLDNMEQRLEDLSVKMYIWTLSPTTSGRLILAAGVYEFVRSISGG